MAEAMNKNKTSQFQSEFSRLNFNNEEAKQYSPATMAAAKKFKRFLGKRLKPEPMFNEKLLPNTSSLNKEHSNHIDFKYQSLTAPNSPYLNRGILSEASPKEEAKESRSKQMINAAVIPCTITLKVPGDQERTITTSLREPNRYSSQVRNSASYMKESAETGKKEGRAVELATDKTSNFQQENNCKEDQPDETIHKYTYKSQAHNPLSDQDSSKCRQNQAMVSSPEKGVHQPKTDTTCDQSCLGKEPTLSGDSEMAALSPIHRLLERNAVRPAGPGSNSEETMASVPCSKLTSVRRPNQVTSGWI